MRIMDARVAAKTAVRRHQMRRIAHHEDSPDLVLAGHIRARTPARYTGDLDLEVRHSGADADEVDQSTLADILRRVGDVRIGFRITNGINGQKTGLAVLGEAEEASEFRV